MRENAICYNARTVRFGPGCLTGESDVRETRSLRDARRVGHDDGRGMGRATRPDDGTRALRSGGARLQAGRQQILLSAEARLMIPDLPEFLRRVDTEDQRRRRSRVIAIYRDRKIKNPPKRAKQSTKLLGRAFGTKINAS